MNQHPHPQSLRSLRITQKVLTTNLQQIEVGSDEFDQSVQELLEVGRKISELENGRKSL
ncbi:hypothetical protein [Hymenobacter chitinivorans]|uniref:hypothetical protein n=1 Tax=Hymenobacter chitinivorans TaxID=89969 RepID=UPI0012FE2026|nr:hypothetical protein [Hymenobacter chitinivorans]